MCSRLTRFCSRGHGTFHFMIPNLGQLRLTKQGCPHAAPHTYSHSTRPFRVHSIRRRSHRPRALSRGGRGSGGCRSEARQLTISPSAHIHLATIRRTCTRVHVACTLGEFPTPCSISERIPMLRHGEGMAKLVQAMRVRDHCECNVGEMDARA